MLVAGEATEKTDTSRQCAGQRGGGEGGPVCIVFHVSPRVEVQAPYHLLADIGNMGVAAEAVRVYIIQAVYTVLAYADGSEAGYFRVSFVSVRINCQAMCLVRGHFSLTV